MTRPEMEERRLGAAPMFTSGMMSADVARRLGVTRTTVSKWRKRYTEAFSACLRNNELKGMAIHAQVASSLLGQCLENGVNALRLRKSTGRPSRLTDEHLKTIRRLHALLAKDGKVTGPRLAAAIKEATGVSFHPDHVYRLRKDLGLVG